MWLSFDLRGFPLECGGHLPHPYCIMISPDGGVTTVYYIQGPRFWCAWRQVNR
jgi:hypothetical protein